jgi:ketosteroid isomerase-like protein
MNELETFRNTILADHIEAETVLALQGDVEPRMALWSHNDPVSLFGAWGPNYVGWDEVSRIFRWVGARLGATSISDFHIDLEVVDVSGNLAYTVGYECFNASVDGGPAEPVKLRVTHIYRRENGEWKVVHRHGDFAPIDESPAREPSGQA